MSILQFTAICLVLALTLPGVLGFKTYVVTSGSMEPEYPVGSLILVESIAPEDIAVGDVITFYMGETETVATHQVYEIDREQKLFRTQGINNRDSRGNIIHDANPVVFDSLIGRPIVCIPFLGSISRFCTATPNNYILIGYAVVIVGISFAIDAIPEKEKSEGTIKNRREQNEKI